MSKPKTATATRPDRKTFWQPPDKRNATSEEGKRWREENAEAIRSINEWVEENGLPLDPYRVT
jgi:DNA-binding PadR family transcriptional regulator